MNKPEKIDNLFPFVSYIETSHIALALSPHIRHTTEENHFRLMKANKSLYRLVVKIIKKKGGKDEIKVK